MPKKYIFPLPCTARVALKRFAAGRTTIVLVDLRVERRFRVHFAVPLLTVAILLSIFFAIRVLLPDVSGGWHTGKCTSRGSRTFGTITGIGLGGLRFTVA
jgi:hypothetical protein